MITHGEDVEIHALRGQGWSISAIARHLGLDRKTVRVHLAGERQAGVRRSSGTDPFDAVADYVRQRLVEDPHVRVTVLFGEARRLGYEASYPTFARRIRHGGLRPQCQACLPGRVHTDIEHPPGEEIQWDWLELRDTPWGAAAFVLVGVLPYSGRLRCWFSESMDQAHLVAGIHQVLVRLGAAPVAGEPTAWLRWWRRAPTGSRRRSRRSPSTMAPRWTCARRRPRRKGAVEKSIDYLTQSWWRTAAVASPEAAQASADRWCREVADMRPRRRGDTVTTVAEAADRETLAALPAAAFPVTLTLERVVAANALVSVWGNRYSVPPDLAGKNVQVTHRGGTDSLEIHTGGGRVAAAHRLAPSGAHRTIRLPHHSEALQAAVLAAFSTEGPCRPKTNRPPSPQAAAIAARLSPNIGADPVIDLDVYRRLTQPEAS